MCVCAVVALFGIVRLDAWFECLYVVDMLCFRFGLFFQSVCEKTTLQEHRVGSLSPMLNTHPNGVMASPGNTSTSDA